MLMCLAESGIDLVNWPPPAMQDQGKVDRKLLQSFLKALASKPRIVNRAKHNDLAEAEQRSRRKARKKRKADD